MTTTEQNMLCLCAVCRQGIHEDTPPAEVAENRVYKCGDLSYIELAHRECAVRHNLETGYGWEWEQ
jgi:hypothetical protein